MKRITWRERFWFFVNYDAMPFTTVRDLWRVQWRGSSHTKRGVKMRQLKQTKAYEDLLHAVDAAIRTQQDYRPLRPERRRVRVD